MHLHNAKRLHVLQRLLDLTQHRLDCCLAKSILGVQSSAKCCKCLARHCSISAPKDKISAATWLTREVMHSPSLSAGQKACFIKDYKARDRVRSEDSHLGWRIRDTFSFRFIVFRAVTKPVGMGASSMPNSSPPSLLACSTSVLPFRWML